MLTMLKYSFFHSGSASWEGCLVMLCTTRNAIVIYASAAISGHWVEQPPAAPSSKLPFAHIVAQCNKHKDNYRQRKWKRHYQRYANADAKGYSYPHQLLQQKLPCARVHALI